MKNTKITTERLELKPIKLEDAEALFKITSNKTTTRYMLYAGTENIQETIDFITDCQKDWNRWYINKNQPNVALNFSIFIKNTTTPIGTIEIDILEDPTTAEMGWMIHNDFQNKGYGSEAAFAIVDFAKKLGIKSIVAHCDKRNIPSFSLMKKIGMKLVSDNGDRIYPKTGEIAKEICCKMEL